MSTRSGWRGIQALLDRYPGIPVVVTCRALDYQEGLQLEKLEIKPLDPDRQRAYLQRYLGETDGERLFWQLAGGDAVAELWQTWQATGGTWDEFWQAEQMPPQVYSRTTGSQDQLWARLRKDDLPPLLAIGRNPFMLVMLAQVWAAGDGSLPANRGHLFAAFLDTLLAREKRRCDPVTWPGDSVIRRGLAALAHAMQTAGEHGTAVDHAWATKQLGSYTADPGALLYLAASATLVDTSGGRVRFVHQLLQEYCAAVAWQEQIGKGAVLSRYWPRGWIEPSGWEETAILLAGMVPDLGGFVAELLPVHPVLAARCIAESGGVTPAPAPIRAVRERLARIATDPTASVRERAATGDALNAVGDERRGVGLRPDGVPNIEWCDVPAGAFTMGNTKQTDEMAFDDEEPQHSEPMPRAYRISKYPVTNSQFAAFVADGGYTEKWRRCWTDAGWKEKGDRSEPEKWGGAYDLPNHPAVLISWYEAAAFCNWLSEKLGHRVGLPTEAQWEKAARGTDGRRYPWRGEITPDHANYDKTEIGSTSAVGIFPRGASPYGLLDMSGNVWGWCATKWRDGYDEPEDNDPGGSDRRVLRGGSFSGDAGYVRCAVRVRYFPGYRSGSFGFRVVASPIIHDSGR